MNGISNFLPYLLISTILTIMGCQSIAERSNTSSDNISKVEPITASGQSHYKTLPNRTC